MGHTRSNNKDLLNKIKLPKIKIKLPIYLT